MRGRLRKYAMRNGISSFFGHMNATLRNGACKLSSGAQWSYTDERPWCRDEPGIQWISMVRDPWERMKSAFLYCEPQWPQGCPGCATDLNGRVRRFDPICNVGPLLQGAPSERACEFARRWGLNYQFEIYVHLDYEQIRRLSCAPPDSECLANPSPPSPWHSEEVGMRDHACLRLAIRSCGLDGNQTAASKALIADAFRAQESLLAVGLVEAWEDSLTLFERETRCPGLANPEYEDDILHNSLKRSDPVAHQLIELAFARCKDEITRTYMNVDYALYAHAKTLFEQQRRGARGQTSGPLGAPKVCTHEGSRSSIVCR